MGNIRDILASRDSRIAVLETAAASDGIFVDESPIAHARIDAAGSMATSCHEYAADTIHALHLRHGNEFDALKIDMTALAQSWLSSRSYRDEGERPINIAVDLLRSLNSCSPPIADNDFFWTKPLTVVLCAAVASVTRVYGLADLEFIRIDSGLDFDALWKSKSRPPSAEADTTAALRTLATFLRLKHAELWHDDSVARPLEPARRELIISRVTAPLARKLEAEREKVQIF